MIFEVITWATVAAGVFSTLVTFFWMLHRPSEPTLEDLPEFLQRLDLDKLRNLLSAASECDLRESLTKAEFKKVQRQRFWMYIQCLRKMANNARVLIDFANAQIEHGDMGDKRAILELILQEAVAVKAYAVLMKVKVYILLFLRIEAYSWLFQQRQLSGLDGIERYERMKTVATQFFLSEAQYNLEQLIESL
jgi:hypothetical protein